MHVYVKWAPCLVPLYLSVPVTLRSISPVHSVRVSRRNSGYRGYTYRIQPLSLEVAMPLNILIVGAGVCGPALALLLQGSHPKHNVTVVECFPSLRAAGQQIDVKSQGIPIPTEDGPS